MSRQLIRNREAFGARPEDMPVFGTSAATFNDNGVTALYQHLAGLLAGHGLHLSEGVLPAAVGRTSTGAAPVIPPVRTGYLAEIAATVRGYHAETARQVAAARRLQRLTEISEELAAAGGERDRPRGRRRGRLRGPRRGRAGPAGPARPERQQHRAHRGLAGRGEGVLGR